MIKIGYPKGIWGSLVLPECKELLLPSIEVTYSTNASSKGESKIDHVTARFVNRAPKSDKNTKQVRFDKSKIIVEYNENKSLYCLTLYSVDSMTSIGKEDPPSDIEQYIADECDVELNILLQIGMQIWGAVTDMQPVITAAGAMVEIAILVSEGETISKSDLPDMPELPNINDIIPNIEDKPEDEDDAC